MSAPTSGSTSDSPDKPSSNFLRHIIEADIARGAYAARLWAGKRRPDTGSGVVAADPARVRTRFPPEPNGYLHIGHAKSIWLNFGLARDYEGACHMRFDDTNPEREEQEYVDTILDSVQWLGFDWRARPFEKAVAAVEDHLYFASDYFDALFQFAEYLISTGHAYVDSQSAEEIRATRGTLTQAGTNSPHRERSVEENLGLFRAMRAGDFEDGAHVLRACIDMAAPNMNMRDPVLYRIRRTMHHRTGDQWCIYPMYDYTHCISDALENITHSICTLEFEDHRPLYDWVLERIVPVLRAPQFLHALDWVRSLREQDVEAQKEFALRCHRFRHKLYSSKAEAQMRELFLQWDYDRDAVLGDLDAFFTLFEENAEQFSPLLAHALEERQPNPFGLPHQFEFARLNLTYVVTSKRRLRQLVNEGYVEGWDDPRMPTLVGLRRRGYTPDAITLLCERTGVSKSDSWIEYSLLEQALRDDLDAKAPRATAVLHPLRLVIDNYSGDGNEMCVAPVHPHHPAMGERNLPFARDLWIEAEDFEEFPQKGYFRLFPGNKVRLRYGYVIECTGCEKNAQGAVTVVHANYLPDTKSGTPGANAIKVKGNIHWLSVDHALSLEVRLYDRLFIQAQPDSGGKDFLESLNPNSKKVITAYLEPEMQAASAGQRYQFERHGYFVADAVDSVPGKPVFNRITTLRDSWGGKD